MRISGSTKVHDLLKEHPFLEDFLPAFDPKFEMLKNKMARATVGRVATLETAAGIAGVDVGRLLDAVANEIEKQTGSRPQLGKALENAGPDKEQRVELLKEIIGDLHDGGDVETAREMFAKALGDVEASEIAAMEEELIKGGLPVSEVQRLCDVHVGAFRDALDQHEEIEVPPGHPVHTYIEANKKISVLADQLGELARRGGKADLGHASKILEQLAGVDNHYTRKENQLFAVLERYGITGPSQVMWGVHDEIRGSLKDVNEAVSSGDAEKFAAAAPALARDLVEMVYKEEKILFPLSLQTLSEKEWVEIRKGERDLGYALAQPAAEWPTEGAAGKMGVDSMENGRLEMHTGELTLEQVNLIFTHLPVDLSFVDETDAVKFYSEGPDRIFPRTPEVIGRKVQNCHPPKSVHMVQAILDAFRAGTQSKAEFWIEMQGKFLHICYYAIKDRDGAYRGCLEVSQDVTGIRALEGERRLLEWEDGA